MNGDALTLTVPARRIPCASLLLAAAAVLIAWMPSASLVLEYDRAAIATGQIWRLVSCHWTHVSADHLIWDVTTFIVLGAICERSSSWRFCVCVLGSAVLIPLAIWAVAPELSAYRGLSGIDCALFGLLAATQLKDAISARSWLGATAVCSMMLALIAKTVYETTTGATVFMDSHAASMLPVPLAHGVGVAVGLIIGFAEFPNKLSFSQKRKVPGIPFAIEEKNSSQPAVFGV